jgi:LDH2 family malate/lactate/ureidoglycolate dehydrogenase
MDESIDYLKNGKKAEGIEEIFVPGEIEANNLKRQLIDGITYPMEIIEENRELSRSLHVEVLI